MPGKLDTDLDQLSSALWAAVSTLGGDDAVETCRTIESEARSLRAGTLAGGRSAFAQRIANLSEDQLEDVSRAFATGLHLMNAAEERERRRVLRMRGDGLPDGLGASIDALLDTGITETDLREWLERALVMPVITAHPTEARRRSSLDHLARIGGLLADGDRATSSRLDASLAAEVLALQATEDARARRPTPIDEVEVALDVFRRSLFDVTPRIYRRLEDRVHARFGASWRVPSLLRWGTWVGGDRDGNPNVTAAVTRATLSRHRALALARYLEDVAALGRSLSISELRVPGTFDELIAALEHDRERMPEVAAHARPRTRYEPWREKLWYVQARLRATIDHRDEGYADADDYLAELWLLDRTLRSAGLADVADQDLRDAIRRAEVFGFHVATLDLRQHSEVHERVVDEVLARGGQAGYRERDETARRVQLSRVLEAPVPPLRETRGLSREAQEVLATLEVAGRARRELGPHACERHVISFTRDASDLLEVAFLARVAGLAPGELRPVPLLEQLEDLGRAGAIARDILALPTLRTELGDQLEVMVGYSDSGKQIGFLASAVVLRRAQLQLADAVHESGVTLTVFHGRGGALGRGGGPESEAILAQPAAAVRGRLRVTEQGETVTARYTHPEIAERELELMLGAVIAAETKERRASAGDAVIDSDEAVLEHAADAARTAYRALTSNEDRLARYTVAATPIEDVAHLPLGSRPASRKKTLSLDSLRAIPWVFSWVQSRHGIPGWFGVGTAIETLASELGDAGVRALVERSRFVRALIQNCELSLVRSDIDVAHEYAGLADPEARAVFELIAAEHARTVAALHGTLGRSATLSSRAYLAESVVRRNPYLDVLSHVQIEALRRRRVRAGDADDAEVIERLGRIVFTTIGGIAAGLQTAG